MNWDFCVTGPPTHQRRRAEKRPTYSLTHCPKVDLLQALRTAVDKGGGEGRVVGLDHQVAAEAPGARGPAGAIAQLKVRVADAQSVVRIKRDGRDLKVLVPEAGSVERLSEVRERNRISTVQRRKPACCATPRGRGPQRLTAADKNGWWPGPLMPR